MHDGDIRVYEAYRPYRPHKLRAFQKAREEFMMKSFVLGISPDVMAVESNVVTVLSKKGSIALAIPLVPCLRCLHEQQRYGFNVLF
jgi:hypothetical protein